MLQENIILSAVKGQPQGEVTLSLSLDADFAHISCRVVDFARIVSPADPERFIHITVSEHDQRYVERIAALPCTLEDLGIDASTGPVVDFRLADYLRADPKPDCRKPNAITSDPPVQQWLYPNGHYTVVRRFSSDAFPSQDDIDAWIEKELP